MAHDPVQAEAQHLSELKKGKRYLDYDKRAEQVRQNHGVLKKVLVGLEIYETTIHGNEILEALGL